MNRNLRTIITDKDGFNVVEYPEYGIIKFKFNPLWDLLSGEELIKTRILPDRRTKYYIKRGPSPFSRGRIIILDKDEIK